MKLAAAAPLSPHCRTASVGSPEPKRFRGSCCEAKLRRLLGKKPSCFIAKEIFSQPGYKTTWSGGNGVRSHAAALLKCIREADQEGLDPGEYSADELEQQVRRVQRSTTANELAWLDAELTYTFFEYAAHLYRGRLNPKRMSPRGRLPHESATGRRFWKRLWLRRDICGALAKLTPALPEYADPSQSAWRVSQDR